MGGKTPLCDPEKIELQQLKQPSCSAETIRRTLQEIFPSNHMSLCLLTNKLPVYHYLYDIVLALISRAKKVRTTMNMELRSCMRKVYVQSGQLACCRASRTTPFSRRSSAITQPAQPCQQQAVLYRAPHL